MIRYLLLAFGLYLLFRLVFNFIIPLFRATRRFKEQMRGVQEQMQQQMQAQQGFAAQNTRSEQPQQAKKTASSDYIEFEEVK